MPAQAGNNWMSYSLLFPYLSVSLASTIFISCLTVLRFLEHRHRISSVLGSNHGSIYASFAAMIIESASIYSVCSVLYIVPFAIGNPLANAFLQILGMAQVRDCFASFTLSWSLISALGNRALHRSLSSIASQKGRHGHNPILIRP